MILTASALKWKRQNKDSKSETVWIKKQ